METYYTLGVVNSFTVHATNIDDLSDINWQSHLNERLDISLFNLKVNEENCYIEGMLKDGVFAQNIEDFYAKLKRITHDSSIDDYFKDYGTNMNQYPDDFFSISFYLGGNKNLNISIDYTSLFIEGKVSVEQFSLEPMLMNWLFRHGDFGNCLAGCIVSCITG